LVARTAAIISGESWQSTLARIDIGRQMTT